MILVLVLVLVALLERLVFDLGPNVELVTMASVLAGLYVSSRWRYVIPLLILLLSDLVLGLGVISLFTWSGFLVMVVLARGLADRWSNRIKSGLTAGVMGTLWFYGWTNFGVWLTDQWGMYANDWSGLVQSYVNGLPFLRLQMMSTLLFVPLGIVLVEMGIEWLKIKRGGLREVGSEMVGPVTS